MAKIVNRENLKEFRKAYDKKLTDGSFKVALSELADDLTPYSENSGVSDTKPFVFQSSGGGSDIDNKSYLRSLHGNTVLFNQLIKQSDLRPLTTETDSGITFTNNSNGSITISGTAEADITEKSITLDIILKPNDKYLVKYGLVGSADTYYIEDAWSGKRSYEDNIFTTSHSYLRLRFNILNTQQVNETIFIQVFNLTQMFGADNEPESELEFNRLFPATYYSYNAGELKSSQTSKYKTVGYNQFDGELENGYINDSGVPQPSSISFRTKNFTRVIAGQEYTFEGTNISGGTNGVYLFQYDINKDFIQKNWLDNVSSNSFVKKITLSSECSYVKLFVNGSIADPSQISGNENICIHLTWDESKTGYEEYKSNEYDLPNVELRKNIATGSYDEILPNGTLISRVGIREYESGDESDATVITDLTNTIYDLDTPTTTQSVSYQYQEATNIDDWGTQEFIGNGIPQGNDFFYAVDYKAFIDSLGGRADIKYDASKIVSHTELTTALGQIPTPDMSNYPTKSGNETITGNWTFSNEIQLGNSGNSIFNQGSSVRLKVYGTTVLNFSSNTLKPLVSNYNLGTTADKFGDLYLSGTINKNSSNYGLSLPDTTSYTANKEIATTDQAFNVINASDIVSNTLTQTQYDLITNGKPTLIKGTLLGNSNPLIYGLLDNGVYGWKALFVGVDYICAIEFPKSSPYTLSRKTNYNASGIKLGRISQINDKNIPNFPSDTGTFVLKCIDGTLTWVAE